MASEIEAMPNSISISVNENANSSQQKTIHKEAIRLTRGKGNINTTYLIF